MSSISLPPGRSAPPYAVDQESLGSFRGRPTRASLREEPEIILGADENEVEAPPLTMVGGGVSGGALERGGRETVPERKISKRKVPERKVSKRKVPEQKVPEQKVPEQKVSKRKVARWKFWKRPDRRAMEVEGLRRGCERVAETVESIRDEMVAAKVDRKTLLRTLSPLPVAAESLQRMGEAQEKTVKVLGGVQESLQRAEEKDAVFFKTMDRFGHSMANMDMVVVGMGRAFSSIERTSKKSESTMGRLSERLDASDRFLEQAFVRLRDTEQEFAQHMVVNSRRSALVTVSICLLLTGGIAILAHTLGSAQPNVTVLRAPVPEGAVEEAVEEAGKTIIPPLDWQILPSEERALAEDQWPLDLSGPEPYLLYANKFPAE